MQPKITEEKKKKDSGRGIKEAEQSLAN